MDHLKQQAIVHSLYYELLGTKLANGESPLLYILNCTTINIHLLNYSILNDKDWSKFKRSIMLTFFDRSEALFRE